MTGWHRGIRTHRGMRRGLDAGISEYANARLLPHGYLRTVACPDCPAEIGDACTASTGNTLSTVHIARRRLAIRKYRAEQEDS